MKKVLFVLAAAVLTAFAHAATMPIASSEPIEEAPAGEVIANLQRKSFSYFYTNGYVDGGYNDSFVGEMVIGTDGNIYLKQPCASAQIYSYLKLEPMNDTLFVAHTAQMVLVDMSGDSPYPYFATRLVFTEYANGTFSWALDEKEDGTVDADMYFIYKDGNLRQRDMTIIERGDYRYPYELLAFTNSNGGWIGFGDGCIELSKSEGTATTLPDGATLQQGSFAYDTLSSKKGINATDAMLLQYAEVGDELYVSSPFNPDEQWIRGTIDREKGTVTFRKQYIGVCDEIGVHQWFIPTTYNDWFDMIDEEENYGYWTRDYQAAEEYVCRYEDGKIVSDSALHQSFTISRSENEINASGNYANIILQQYEEKAARPINPIFTNFEENNGLWGEIAFYLSPVDKDNMFLNHENLYYRIYRDHATEPYEFTTDNYWEITENMVTIPALFDDDQDFIVNNGLHHLVIFYDEWKVAGVQAIYKDGETEYTSDIVWSDGQVTENTEEAVSIIRKDNDYSVEKQLQNGELRIIKNGVVYSVIGQIL